MHPNAVQLAGSRLFVTGSNDADGGPAASQSASENGESGSRAVTCPTWVMIGEEDDPHPSIPHVGLLHPRESARNLTALLPHPRDHLAEKTKPEEHDAADDHRLDQVEERPQPNAVTEAQNQGDDPGQQADDEEDRTAHPEEEHGLSTKPQLKPDRDEVEEADGNSPPVELRGAGTARVQRNRKRRQPVAVRRGDDHHIAMPVRPQRDAEHDLPTIRLDRVEVAHPNAE